MSIWNNVRRMKLSGCWLWTASKSRTGYGLASYKGKTWLAHRASWTATNGAIPEGKLVLHKCDVRACINPDHLFLGSYKDNMDDMYRKGRGPTAKRNGSHTMPHRRATGARNGSRTCPGSRPHGDQHYARQHPERLARGERNGRAKLTDLDVRSIRYAYRRGARQVDLARSFNVSQTHISRLTRGVQR